MLPLLAVAGARQPDIGGAERLAVAAHGRREVALALGRVRQLHIEEAGGGRGAQAVCRFGAALAGLGQAGAGGLSGHGRVAAGRLIDRQDARIGTQDIGDGIPPEQVHLDLAHQGMGTHCVDQRGEFAAQFIGMGEVCLE